LILNIEDLEAFGGLSVFRKPTEASENQDLLAVPSKLKVNVETDAHRVLEQFSWLGLIVV